MTFDQRPSPDELLKAIKREELQKTRGKLKIFLGMAAGVGKTYSMLEEAQGLKREGVNLVVGIVDTHGRKETGRLLEGLTVIPQAKVDYKDKEFEEMDLDAILKIHPEIVLVDELAHTNIPGLRHSKRWEDVVEILENGIDVLTTLNVQHIESLNDVIEGIAEITVRETVPDLMIEKAASIQLVDLTPDELLQRLKEGKVYLGDQSRVASLNFFQKDRLTALREIVLRFTAEKVDRDLHEIVSPIHRVSGWKPREKLLVAVSSSPQSQKLIRTTRRLAFNQDAPWIALNVDDGKELSEFNQNTLIKNLALARDLGAEVMTVNDPNISDAIQRIARQRGVTQIILGRPPKRLFAGFFKGFSILDKIAVECVDIDLHVIRQGRTPRSPPEKKRSRFQTAFSQYIFVFLISIFFAFVNYESLPYIGYRVSGFIFLVGILVLSLFFKKGPILFASILYAVIWNSLFIPAGDKFSLTVTEDNALVVLYFLTAISTGILVDRAREQQVMLRKREETTLALYDIARQIATATSTQDLLKSIKDHLSRIFKGTFEILVKHMDSELPLDNAKTLIDDPKEVGAALWVFDNGKEAGWSTSTLPSVKNLYLPLKGFHEVVGLLIYRPKRKSPFSMEEKNFLYTVIQQLSTYLERIFSEERTRLLEHLDQKEKIYQDVLSSISNELENPLFSIQEAVQETVQTLKDEPSRPKKSLDKHIHKIENSSDRLLRILGSVSAMAKLSNKLLPINKELHPIKTVIQGSFENLKTEFEKRRFLIHYADDVDLVPYDFSLIEILLHNLLLNAIQNSPPDSTIEIEVTRNEDFVIISILDEGKGVPEDVQEVIFEKFKRVPGAMSPGMGLGLAIAKKIAEAHDGDLKVENRPDKGAKFSLFLPIK